MEENVYINPPAVPNLSQIEHDYDLNWLSKCLQRILGNHVDRTRNTTTYSDGWNEGGEGGWELGRCVFSKYWGDG